MIALSFLWPFILAVTGVQTDTISLFIAPITHSLYTEISSRLRLNGRPTQEASSKKRGGVAKEEKEARRRQRAAWHPPQ